MMRQISVIVPALNEARCIEACLSRLAEMRGRGHEVIVVDGGSWDDTPAIARRWADRVIFARRGRAPQMNAGAATAAGDILLFLHADTLLPPLADIGILMEMERLRRRWGRFDVRLSGTHPMLRVIEQGINFRSRLTGVATGDQAVFVERELWREAGGFPDIPLMEDVALSKILKRHGPPLCLWRRAVTASRRWEERGVIRTMILMWYLRAAFSCGADPAKLRRLYERR
jgi:rSAM/selenodomain-associated transferase 2